MAIQLIKRERCLRIQAMSQKNLLAYLNGTSTGSYLASIPTEDWQIYSFDPSLAEVCINVFAPSGTRRLSITLPIFVEPSNSNFNNNF